MHGKPRRGKRLNLIRGVTSLRNTLDCRALKMPGYLFLLTKSDKQRTKDLGLCNLGCRGLAMFLRRSQGGGGRMSSRQGAPSVAIISARHHGNKPTSSALQSWWPGRSKALCGPSTCPHRSLCSQLCVATLGGCSPIPAPYEGRSEKDSYTPLHAGG